MPWRCQARVDGDRRDVAVGRATSSGPRSRRPRARPWPRRTSATTAARARSRTTSATTGRGYTCDSMRTTPRRWRRRIGTMCTVEVDDLAFGRHQMPLRSQVELGVALAEVHRQHLRRRAGTPRVRSARARARRARVRLGDACADPRARPRAPERRERVGEPQRTVAAHQRVLAARLELGDEIVGRAELVLRHALHAARHLAVDRPVELVAAGVDGRDDEPARVAAAGTRADRGSGPGSRESAATARAPSRS